MSEKDTYEFGEQKTILERIEWDHLWFQEATDTVSRRVLLIGDSITRACRNVIYQRLSPLGVVVDQLATSKGNDNPYLIPLIDYAIAQQPSCCVLQLWLSFPPSVLYNQNNPQYPEYLPTHLPLAP